MRRTSGTGLERLRRSPRTALVAVLLLLIQVVLLTDHLGASAARAFAGTDDRAALGLLALCHGDGSLATLDVASDPSGPAPGADVSTCVLCAGMAIAGASVFAVPPALPILDLPFDLAPAAPEDEAAPGRPLLRYGIGRGPPVVTVV